MSEIEKVNFNRERITEEEMMNICSWAFGDEGELLSKVWQGLNQDWFYGKLNPLPIFITNVFPYGSAIARCFGNPKFSIAHHIEIKESLDEQKKVDVLLHEMIHQFLFESNEKSDHNAKPWCREIMRLGKEIWDYEFFASPSVPRKVTVDGVRRSYREQKEGSIELKQISGFPLSLKLNTPYKDYL